MALRDLNPGQPITWPLVRAIVANTPTSPSDDLYITIPSHPNPQHKFGPVAWQPHGSTLPTAGTAGLAGMDENGVAWLLAWI